ncbi:MULTISPECIES: hypothetical protein [unclassified Streptomyces]|uniref:hypothetical protein n=1 Tax=unclassified Streptomyces TaxID=2593676 RepID=UPI002883875A|nr:hypothetical protein [Streptomyces sp. DSM 41633]
MRTKSILLSLVAVLSAFGLYGAQVSAAAPVNGSIQTCGTNQSLCIYYNSDNKGSRVGIYGKVHNYDANPTMCSSQGCSKYSFQTSGNGYGQYIKNNAASAYNADFHPYRVYYNSGWSGPVDEFDPKGYGTYFGNLVRTYNQNASQQNMCAEC